MLVGFQVYNYFATSNKCESSNPIMHCSRVNKLYVKSDGKFVKYDYVLEYQLFWYKQWIKFMVLIIKIKCTTHKHWQKEIKGGGNFKYMC